MKYASFKLSWTETCELSTSIVSQDWETRKSLKFCGKAHLLRQSIRGSHYRHFSRLRSCLAPVLFDVKIGVKLSLRDRHAVLSL